MEESRTSGVGRQTAGQLVRDVVSERRLEALGALLSAVGILTVTLGWYGAAHTTIVQYQIPYLISGGMLGAALVVLGGIVVVAGLGEHRHAELLDALEQLGELAPVARAVVDVVPPTEAREPARSPVRPPGFAAAGSVLCVSGGASYHTGDCQIVQGKVATELTVSRATRRGLVPCRVCHPAVSGGNGRTPKRTRL